MKAFLSRMASIVHRRQMDREMDDEIASHLELATEDLQARGLSAREAALAARRHFGGVSRTKESERESRGFPLLEDWLRDARYALRGLRRNPGTTAVIIVTLALGIGATAAIFSAVDAVLLKRVPVHAPHRLVNVYTVWAARTTTNPDAGDQLGPTSYPNYLDLAASGALQSLAAFAPTTLTLDANGATERVTAQVVTGNYFDVLGLQTVVGRPIRVDDDQVNAPARVAVLSYAAWQERFGGDPAIAGRTLSVNGSPYTILGVAPRRFTGTTLGQAPEMWVPMAMQPEVRPPSAGALRQRLGGLRMLDSRDITWLDLVGRLKDGSSSTEIAAAFDVIGRQLAASYPDVNRDRTATALPLGTGPGIREQARPILSLLTIAVTLVLLIACANVASVLLARAVTRRREVAVRIAVGAGRGRLVRQWLTESIMLAAFGAAGGLLVAMWMTPVLYGFGALADIDLSLDVRVLMFTLAASVVTGVVFGLAPAWQLLKPDTLPALRDEGGGVAGGARAGRLRSAFVVVQVALSLILLVGAGLFIRTFRQALAVDLGYQVDRVLLAEVTPGEHYTPATGQGFYRTLIERIEALPGVERAGAARVTVLSGASRTVPVSSDGQPLRQDRANVIPVRANVVTDGYLSAMGITVRRGRDFGPSDATGAPRVGIVSESLARRLWRDEDPVGRTFQTDGPPVQVIGVVPDTVYVSATEQNPRPFFYLPVGQNYEAALTLHVRTRGSPMALLPAVRQTIRGIDPRVALTRPRALEDEFNRSTAAQRTMAILVGALSAIALLLAAVGLYGVIAYAARQRTTEMGLRLALGATPRSILTLIVSQGARLVAIGTVLGLAGAFLSVSVIRGQLFGVEPTDPTTWVAVSGILLLVGLVACAIPAIRAMRIAPISALRVS